MKKEVESRKLAIQTLKEAPPATLFQSPIDYIYADHFRHRTLCNLLVDIADETELDRDRIEAVLGFLQKDFRTHVADEEEDLFPLLLKRANSDDGMDDMLTELRGDHVRDTKGARRITKLLTERLASVDSSHFRTDDRNLLRQFAKHEKHHLTLENAIILPLARARLTDDDQRNLGKHMAARRGLAYPEEENAR